MPIQKEGHTAVIAVLVQSFLVVRYWWFTQNILVTLLIIFLILVAFGGSLACGMIIAIFPAFKEREKVKIPATIWLVTEAVADLGIAAALLWEFRKARRNLGRNGEKHMAHNSGRNTKQCPGRLVAVTIQTGIATATLAVAALIAFLLEEESDISVGIAYTLGRVYVLSMLANLNVRRSGKSASVAHRGVSSATGPGTLTFTSIGIDDFRSSCSCFCLLHSIRGAEFMIQIPTARLMLTPSRTFPQ
ncbi:hypothetical protein B0H14DRAFT_3563300 [Mycena olivaceomarginata]|nr:hypothetical protein B0H14DRAFT_3563300 [Mycena olivaceomarginata]